MGTFDSPSHTRYTALLRRWVSVPKVQARVHHFRETHSDWRSLVSYMLSHLSGALYSTICSFGYLFCELRTEALDLCNRNIYRTSIQEAFEGTVARLWRGGRFYEADSSSTDRSARASPNCRHRCRCWISGSTIRAEIRCCTNRRSRSVPSQRNPVGNRSAKACHEGADVEARWLRLQWQWQERQRREEGLNCWWALLFPAAERGGRAAVGPRERCWRRVCSECCAPERRASEYSERFAH